VRGRKGHHQPIADWIGRQGYALMRADGKLVRVDAFKKLDRYREHDVEAVVADLRGNPSPGPALDEALRVGKGSCFLATPAGDILSWFSSTRTDIDTGESFPELDPKDFSFNSPRGWCPTCRGYGRIYPWMAEPDDERSDENAERLRQLGLGGDEGGGDGAPCPDCRGERLNRVSRAVRLHFRGRRPPLSLPSLLACPPSELIANLEALDLDERGRLVTRDIVPQIRERLRFMGNVGLGYLSLDRPTKTLSGGEAQRIRLAAQLGTNLAGVLYVLDEPSIGLHARDNMRLIATLLSLRDKGNTLVVVEHDDELMRRADLIIDLGPGAGVHGGELIAVGTPAEIRRNRSSVTGIFLARGIRHPLRGAYRDVGAGAVEGPWIELTGAAHRNLRAVNLRIPPGRLTMVAGPSGAGKSTLFRDLLGPAVAFALKARRPRITGRALARASGAGPALFSGLRGAQGLRSVVEVDQSPIGRTPRSTPATYLGIFDLIRKFFAALPESKIRGYTASRFSFNTVGGRCPTCEGAGRIRLEMSFMPDTYLPCDDCQGLRYGPELADITWKGLSIGAVLRLTFEEAAAFFGFHSELSAVCRLMADCGLGYLTLGQSSSTLSGGEAQRLKLVTELSKGLATYRERSRGSLPRNLYILEEPTIGLHLSDCEKLIGVLQSLVDQGHTVIVIEHNLDLIAEADYVVELGPGGGPDGGRLLYQGALKGLLRVRGSPTAPFLRRKIRAAAR
jgi:excinuclease ABC subunit A